jgi:hypothetical protein
MHARPNGLISGQQRSLPVQFGVYQWQMKSAAMAVDWPPNIHVQWSLLHVDQELPLTGMPLFIL